MSNKSKKEIVVSKIVYLHGSGRKTIMHTKNGQTEFYRKLSDCAEEKCFSSFLDIHKSFLVNPAYIERVEGIDHLFAVAIECQGVGTVDNRTYRVQHHTLRGVDSAR